MKKLLLLAICLLLLSQAGHAQGVKLGVGAFGGVEVPVIQDDQSSGSHFGFKGRLKLAAITFEPFVSFASYGGADIDEVIDDPDGNSITGFGLDAVLFSGFGAPRPAVFLFAGIGSYSADNDQMDYDQSDIGYSFGLGLEVGVAKGISLEGRGRFLAINTDGGATKKSGIVTAGLNYHFGM